MVVESAGEHDVGLPKIAFRATDWEGNKKTAVSVRDLEAWCFGRIGISVEVVNVVAFCPAVAKAIGGII